jgi:hypothetical protein
MPEDLYASEEVGASCRPTSRSASNATYRESRGYDPTSMGDVPLGGLTRRGGAGTRGWRDEIREIDCGEGLSLLLAVVLALPVFAAMPAAAARPDFVGGPLTEDMPLYVPNDHTRWPSGSGVGTRDEHPI